MKTTIEIPDPLLRMAKSHAAARGLSLKALFSDALRQRLAVAPAGASGTEPAWMQGFGALRHLHKETARVQARITATFDVIESGDRA